MPRNFDSRKNNKLVCGRCCVGWYPYICVGGHHIEMNDVQTVITDGYGFRPFLMEIIMSPGA